MPHDFVIAKNNIGTCSLCGEVRQYPWVKGEVIVLKEGDGSCDDKQSDTQKEEYMSANLKERHRYYEEHKDEIIADIRTIGRVATRKKWNIPDGGAMISLIKRWLTQEERDAISPDKGMRSPKPECTIQPGQFTESPLPTDGKLPTFPKFSDAWVPSVQVRWLEIYEKLLSSKGNEEG